MIECTTNPAVVEFCKTFALRNVKDEDGCVTYFNEQTDLEFRFNENGLRFINLYGGGTGAFEATIKNGKAKFAETDGWMKYQNTKKGKAFRNMVKAVLAAA